MIRNDQLKGIQAMTEERNQLAELFAACWKNDALSARSNDTTDTVLKTTFTISP